MFGRFVELQDRVLAIALRKETLLLNPDGQPADAFGRARWELARALGEYQLFKSSHLYAPFELRQDYRGAQVRRMKVSCTRAGEDFRQFVLKWSGVSILDRWHDYQPAALQAIAHLRAQLGRDRIEVAELLEIRNAA